MKVAIPVFGDRISPRFDCARMMRVFDFEPNAAVAGQDVASESWAPHERINRLLDLGVTTVICGGIDWWSAESLRSAGVTLFAGVTGEAWQAFEAWARGELVDRGEPCCPDPQSRRGGFRAGGGRAGGGRRRGRQGHGGAGRGSGGPGMGGLGLGHRNSERGESTLPRETREEPGPGRRPEGPSADDP